MKHIRLLLSVASLLVGATACTTPMITMPPGPPEYRIGFHDGCDAGYTYAGSPFYSPDDPTTPLRLDQPYAAGWQAGFDRCLTSFQRIQKAIYVVWGPPL